MRILYIPSFTCFLCVLFGSLCFITVSCEYDTYNIPDPQFDKKLVVHSFIAPTDTELYVGLAYNQKVLGKQELSDWDLPDAKVFLLHGTKEAQFALRNDSFVLKTRDFPILSGETYFLKVIDSEGRVATSNCEIPFPGKMDVNVKANTEFYEEEWGKFIVIKFDTELSKLNTEKIYLKALYYYETYSHSAEDTTKQLRNISIAGGSVFYNKYGETSVSFYKEIVDYYYESLDSAFLKVLIMEYPEEYVTYKKSIDDYLNIYFSEPQFVYSNITGGYGFFGGYTKQEFRMKLNIRYGRK